MRRRLLSLGLLAALPLLAAPQAEAQRVNADVWIGTGPVFGRVSIRDDPYDRYSQRRRYERPVVIVQPRVLVVDRIKPKGRGWSHGWYRNFRHEHRMVVVYFDPRSKRYYDRPFRRGLHEVRVYERGGRHYWIDSRDRDWDDDRRRYSDRNRDRDDRRDYGYRDGERDRDDRRDDGYRDGDRNRRPRGN